MADSFDAVGSWIGSGLCSVVCGCAVAGVGCVVMEQVFAGI